MVRTEIVRFYLHPNLSTFANDVRVVENSVGVMVGNETVINSIPTIAPLDFDHSVSRDSRPKALPVHCFVYSVICDCVLSGGCDDGVHCSLRCLRCSSKVTAFFLCAQWIRCGSTNLFLELQCTIVPLARALASHWASRSACRLVS